ncbi:cation:proton antiporter [Burkholderia pseudomallei]|uniref:cation:proton antiporter n=1 Tax=Burkholderia pseudomallei TaxID=28450 RepID=UPI002962154D|nr:cation:proton antiporter [Burkholderia pseudomallei]
MEFRRRPASRRHAPAGMPCRPDSRRGATHHVARAARSNSIFIRLSILQYSIACKRLTMNSDKEILREIPNQAHQSRQYRFRRFHITLFRTRPIPPADSPSGRKNGGGGGRPGGAPRPRLRPRERNDVARATTSTGVSMNSIFVFLSQALLIVAVPPLLMNYLRVGAVVPLVVVQIVFGVVIGPSGLGRLSPETYTALFPPDSLTFLSHVSAIALFFFAIVTGLHLDATGLRGHGRKLGFISTASMLAPMSLGVLAGIAISARYPQALDPHASVAEFVAGIGICCGVTALPVLAAILRETNLTSRRLGQFSLALAAVNDGMLWILLAAFLSVTGANAANGGRLFITSALIVLYFVSILFVVRPLLLVLANRLRTSVDTQILIACAVAVASAAATDRLGLHYLLGAFIAGAIIPGAWRDALLERMQPVTVNVLTPFFFISTGLRVLIDVDAPGFLQITLIITLCTAIGKIAGTTLAARMTGESWGFCLGLGFLAQAKGLMELVVATILLDSHVISRTVFSALILMALISTAFAMPLLRLKPVRGAALSA